MRRLCINCEEDFNFKERECKKYRSNLDPANVKRGGLKAPVLIKFKKKEKPAKFNLRHIISSWLSICLSSTVIPRLKRTRNREGME